MQLLVDIVLRNVVTIRTVINVIRRMLMYLEYALSLDVIHWMLMSLMLC